MTRSIVRQPAHGMKYVVIVCPCTHTHDICLALRPLGAIMNHDALIAGASNKTTRRKNNIKIAIVVNGDSGIFQPFQILGESISVVELLSLFGSDPFWDQL